MKRATTGVLPREKNGQLLKTEEFLHSLAVGENHNYEDVELKIMKNFSRLHGLLQLEEESLLKKLYESQSRREKCLNRLRTQLQTQIQNVKGLVGEVEYLVQNPQFSDLTDLYKKILEVKNLPRYLISKENNQEPLKVEFKDEVIESLRSFCTLEVPSSETFELSADKDLFEDSDETETLESDCKPSSESTFGDLETLNEDSSQTTPNPDSDTSKKFSKFKTSNKFIEGRNYSVRLSYIKNPGEFYITLNSQIGKLNLINRKASKYALNGLSVSKEVLKDEIYLLQYQVDEKWYRARIVDVVKRRNTSEEVFATVYYLDYGNTETVPVSRLRLAPPQLLEEPPLAVKCKLFDCVPKNGKYCAEVTKIMGEILENSTATMFVMKVNSSFLEVDLSKFCPESQIGSEIISVRDSLMFLGFLNFVAGSRRSTKNLLSSSFRYKTQFNCLPERTFKVVISHVNDPSDFYVQRVKEDIPFVYEMSLQLQKVYSNNQNKGIIYNPIIGIACAAKYSGDGRWYRAEIVDIPKSRTIKVRYVDYGNEEILPWSSVRKLKDNFLKFAPLAINCSLAEIQPRDSSKWNSEAQSYLEENMCQEQFQIKILSRSKQKAKVLLFRKKEKREVCINSVFVELGYAVCTNPTSSWMKPKTEDLIIGEIAPSFNRKMKKKRKETVFSVVLGDELSSRLKTFVYRKAKLNAKELRDKHVSEKQNLSEENTSDEEAISDGSAEDNIYRAKVEVLSAESPSSIYVTLVNLKNKFSDLVSKMDKFYENSSPVENEKWVMDSKCAVYSPERNHWYRGTVVELISDDKVKVFLKDVAATSVSLKSSLRVLDESFMRFGTFTLKCHLADICPAGKQWPSLSSEFLQSELESYNEIYLAKKGEINNKSLPVELWVKRLLAGGALEPTIKEWITLNQLLVDQGLAVPVKPKIKWDDFPLEDASPDKENELGHPSAGQGSDSFLQSLTRWLPSSALNRRRFLGIPTYVDYDGSVFIQDVEDQPKLKMMRKILGEEFEHSKPTNEDQFWTPEQLCIVKYFIDNSWYRGKILKVNDDLTYDVLFVDFGNVETCDAASLRKRVKMMDIPILTRKFRVKGIHPVPDDGTWPIPVIDTFHSLVVDKVCKVDVLEESLVPGQLPVISLEIIENNIDVASFLVAQGLARCEPTHDLGDCDREPFSDKHQPPRSDYSFLEVYIGDSDKKEEGSP